MKLAFEPHTIERDKFHPIGKHIVVSDMVFDERLSNGGIILLNDDMKSQGIRPRWAQVYALGPDYDDDLEVGQWICIAHGRWTRGIDVKDETGKKTLRRVDENDILLVSDEPVNDTTMSDKEI
jgi:co-chaperonin GroES (HSP10)